MTLIHDTRVVAIAATLAAGLAAQSFETPFRVQAGGKPIDVDVGHAAPYVVDFDGDGVRDLLVGQFGGGKLRIYKNQGTDAQPRFGNYEYMKAGADLGTVPAS